MHAQDVIIASHVSATQAAQPQSQQPVRASVAFRTKPMARAPMLPAAPEDRVAMQKANFREKPQTEAARSYLQVGRQ